MTTAELASYLGFHIDTIRHWRRKPGRGPAYIKLSPTAVRYKVSDVEDFLLERGF
jgi:hypothetical protein